ncbi:MAG: cellulase family glycosylhydrolase, partial [Pseudonocardiales bacterium]|nr:cellulase family glycosylhydrolase [Pseudonocardiales bacterium]
DATSAIWCGNTVRLQVSQYDVTPDGSTCDAAFLSQALDPEVREAEADGMVAVINDTTESDPAANAEKDPTTGTFTFWDCVAHHTEQWPGGQAYGQDPQVIFDIFNEPRADACTSPNGPYDMNLWRNGGTYTGCGQMNVSYQGMDAVVYHLRQDGAQNLLWVEGPGTGNSLAGLAPSGGPSYLITDSLHRVVYSIHHPYASATVPANSTTWWNEFGYLIDHPVPVGVAPVVAGEWTNVTAAVQDNPYCWLDAPTSVPAFLSYLQKLGVGMNAYQLAIGYLLKADGPPWTDTTNYTDSPWKSSYCTYSSGQRPPLLGAGADIRAWFQAQD